VALTAAARPAQRLRSSTTRHAARARPGRLRYRADRSSGCLVSGQRLYGLAIGGITLVIIGAMLLSLG
jgi:hypothetical protein